MTSRIKKVYNVKLLYRWQAPQWFTMLFILLAIAVPIVCFFMPYFNFVIAGATTETVVTGKDIVFYLFQQKSPNLEYLITEVFVKTIKPVEIGNLFPMLMYAFGPLLMLEAVFALFLLICFFRLIFTGALKWWGAPRGLGIASFVVAVPLYGFPLGMSLFYNLAAPAESMTPKFDILWPCIYLGVSFVTMLSLIIIYSAGFKNKEFIPNELYLDNYVAMMTGEERKHSYPGNVITIPPQVDPSTTEEQKQFLKKKQGEPVVTKETVVAAAAPTPVVVNVAAPSEKGEKVVTKVQTITKYELKNMTSLPPDIKSIGGHAFSQNTSLLVASIPNNITTIGNSAFANCVNLKVVDIPVSVTKIGYNAFFHCPKLVRINYSGSMREWKKVKRGSNWLANSGTTIVVCNNGALSVNPYK